MQLHISERTGRGVPEITEIYGKETYEFRENSIVVIIPFNKLTVETKVSDSTQESTQDDTQEEKILAFCSEAKSFLDIMCMLGYKERKSVRKHLNPLLEEGRVAMTIPDKPNSKNQKYITVKLEKDNTKE